MDQQQYTNSFGKVYLTVQYDPANQWLYNDWQGLLSTDTVVQGCEGVLRALEATNCAYILNDNRGVIGSWNQANDWIEQHWMPQALAAGLTRFAHVVAPGIFGQSSAEAMHQRVGTRFEMCLFQDIEAARNWLLLARKNAEPA
ncbi:hypothetical protein FY528_18540 [Hymenobacter lutimineralis]|uniref:STAS/SEC14 domain-containing protein n=1 Tax=Hymenobacter lutimineralis TaxID=2606448 RepID=A0A5D6UTF3_9BACT|nr:hypothetical protein [Hymenobacter lutimineralis]TYZ06370.1 hypothetical protein FY528_18540 [Hymenobacter lutimineralis]